MKYQVASLTGAICSVLFMKNLERKIYQTVLSDSNLSVSHRLSLHLQIGESYCKQKQFDKAAVEFDKVFNASLPKGLAYNPLFKTIIRAYLSNNQNERAQQVLLQMLENKHNDKQYRKLEREFSDLLVHQ